MYLIYETDNNVFITNTDRLFKTVAMLRKKKQRIKASSRIYNVSGHC